jgi:TonB family protein
MWKLAVIEVDGQTLTLRTPEAAEEAFLRGQLEPETLVFMRDDSGRLSPSPMQDIAQFRELLGLDAIITPSAPDIAQSPKEPDGSANVTAEEITPSLEDESKAGPDETTLPMQDPPRQAGTLSDLMKTRVDESAPTAAPSEPPAEAPPAAASVKPKSPLSALAAAPAIEEPGQQIAPADEASSKSAGAVPKDAEALAATAAVAAIPLEALSGLASQSQPPPAALEPVGAFEQSEPLPDEPELLEETVETASDAIEPEGGADDSEEPVYDGMSSSEAAGGSSGPIVGPNMWLLGVIAILVLMLAVLGYMQFSGSDGEEAAPASSEASVGQVFTGFAIIDAPVFGSPDPSAVTGAKLLYGEQVNLLPVAENLQWHRIESGPLTGRFVPSELVSTAPPVALDRTRAGDLRLAMAAEVRSAGDLQSPVIRTIAPGQTFRILGIFTGADGGDWGLVEVGSGAALRPGYIALSANVPLDQTEEKAVSDDTIVGTPTDRDLPAQCGRIANAFDRLACQYPDVARRENQLRNAYASAEQRFASAGQKMLPYTRFRSRIDACRTPACARDEIAQQIDLLNNFQPTVAPVQTVNRSAAAKPRNNPGEWIRSRDYPKSALKENREGNVSFTLSVDTRGRVSNCSVTRSSGHADLDEATCDAVKRKARFEPARDSSGQAIMGTYSSSVGWQLPR